MQFLNWLAVLVAAIVNMVVGFLWYGPLFSGLFLRLIGKRKEEIEASPLVYPLGSVMGLVTTTPLGSLPVEPQIEAQRKILRNQLKQVCPHMQNAQPAGDMQSPQKTTHARRR